jgi:hypothetical protein
MIHRDGSLDNRRVDVEVPIPAPKNNGMEGFDVNIIAPAAQDLMKRVSNLTKQGVEKKNLLVSEAREILEELESEKLIEQVDIQKEAIRAVEESGIIVVDEIDKIVSHGDSRGSDASAEGVFPSVWLYICLSVSISLCLYLQMSVCLWPVCFFALKYLLVMNNINFSFVCCTCAPTTTHTHTQVSNVTSCRSSRAQLLTPSGEMSTRSLFSSLLLDPFTLSSPPTFCRNCKEECLSA